MALQSLTRLGEGGSGIPDQLPAAVRELQGLRMKLVAGTTAVTNIAIAGIKTTDTVIAAINLTDLADVSELPSVTSAGNIQFPTANTSSKTLLIVYFVK